MLRQDPTTLRTLRVGLTPRSLLLRITWSHDEMRIICKVIVLIPCESLHVRRTAVP